MSVSEKTRLSPQQAEVVRHVDGPLVVIAGPGSGKTRVLTERVRALLSGAHGHFRVLALTFTNKSADEMRERLTDLGEARQRAFIGTLHGFCLEMLAERGKFVGVIGTPNIFEQLKDRREILQKAIQDDPVLYDALDHIPDSKERGRRIDEWLQLISRIKARPISYPVIEDEFEARLVSEYDAGMRACDAYDFDDLLLLAYRLLTENPKLADFYRKLYKYICIDEAQDLSEAQYAVICALCSDESRNVMLVGDPKQAIYGFNASSPEFMEKFRVDFHAKQIELTENFRSSDAVVKMARSLDPQYLIAAQLPIAGQLTVMVGNDEVNEAEKIVSELERLFDVGHPDVEGRISPSSCAVLGRTRFVLLAVEKELKKRNISHFKRLTANHENESECVDEFNLALRVIANPKDRLHLATLAKKWKVSDVGVQPEGLVAIELLANESLEPNAMAILTAARAIMSNASRVNLMPALSELRKYADTLTEAARLAIYEDVTVLQQEWDQYLRSGSGNQTIVGFMSGKALGANQRAGREGVALLTVHSSKGLEFDVVFIAGMAEGTFPDYRAHGKAMEEETRNAFVAVTRSKRLLYLSYPAMRVMPWGGVRSQSPSRFLSGI